MATAVREAHRVVQAGQDDRGDSVDLGGLSSTSVSPVDEVVDSA